MRVLPRKWILGMDQEIGDFYTLTPSHLHDGVYTFTPLRRNLHLYEGAYTRTPRHILYNIKYYLGVFYLISYILIIFLVERFQLFSRRVEG